MTKWEAANIQPTVTSLAVMVNLPINVSGFSAFEKATGKFFGW